MKNRASFHCCINDYIIHFFQKIYLSNLHFNNWTLISNYKEFLFTNLTLIMHKMLEAVNIYKISRTVQNSFIHCSPNRKNWNKLNNKVFPATHSQGDNQTLYTQILMILKYVIGVMLHL